MIIIILRRNGWGIHPLSESSMIIIYTVGHVLAMIPHFVHCIYKQNFNLTHSSNQYMSSTVAKVTNFCMRKMMKSDFIIDLFLNSHIL